MGWKPKEKPLTHEEAIELARKELAPYWLGSAPLLAGVRTAEGKATVHPLDPAFGKQAWMILVVDLMSFSGEGVMQFARQWSKRYSAHGFGVLLVVKPAYSFMNSIHAILSLVNRGSPIGIPVVLDHDGALSDAFGAKAALPRLVMLQGSRLLLERDGEHWLDGSEVRIQQFLREKDPGLPLSMPLEKPVQLATDAGKIDFKGAAIPNSIQLGGRWTKEAERIVTQDPAATLRFRSPSARVALVGQLGMPSGDATRIKVEIGGASVFETAAGADLAFADDGSSELRVLDPKLYEMLAALPLHAREVTLRFPDADRLPAALYGLRFSS